MTLTYNILTVLILPLILDTMLISRSFTSSIIFEIYKFPDHVIESVNTKSSKTHLDLAYGNYN